MGTSESKPASPPFPSAWLAVPSAAGPCISDMAAIASMEPGAFMQVVAPLPELEDTTWELDSFRDCAAAAMQTLPGLNRLVYSARWDPNWPCFPRPRWDAFHPAKTLGCAHRHVPARRHGSQAHVRGRVLAPLLLPRARRCGGRIYGETAATALWWKCELRWKYLKFDVMCQPNPMSLHASLDYSTSQRASAD